MPVERSGAFCCELQQVADPGSEDSRVQNDEHDQRHRQLERRVVGNRVFRPHHPINNPGLAPDLSRDPAGEDRYQTCWSHCDGEAQKVPGFKQYAVPPHPSAPSPEQHHEETEADHDAESPEHDRRVRPILRSEILQSRNLAVPTVGQNQAAEMWHFDRIARRLGGHVGPAEQDQRHTFAGLALPMPFDRGDLRRLMLARHEPVRIANSDLYRCNDEDKPHGHRQHRPHGGRIVSFE